MECVDQEKQLQLRELEYTFLYSLTVRKVSQEISRGIIFVRSF